MSAEVDKSRQPDKRRNVDSAKAEWKDRSSTLVERDEKNLLLSSDSCERSVIADLIESRASDFLLPANGRKRRSRICLPRLPR